MFFSFYLASYVLQILDHVGIYMLIAGSIFLFLLSQLINYNYNVFLLELGSYTPFLLIGLHRYTSATVLLIAEWLAAAAGTMFVSKL